MTRLLRAPSRFYPFFYPFASVRARHDDRDASGPVVSGTSRPFGLMPETVAIGA